MPLERRQFGILYRDFLRRIVDLDVLSSQGDIQKLLIQFAAMLAAFSFSFLLFAGPKYFTARVSAVRLHAAVAHEYEFLIATTMTVAGLFAVLAWNSVLPDRRDCLILGLLPVRTRTIFFAKVSAIGTALGVAVVALHSFTGLCFPFFGLLPGSGIGGALRSFAAYWVAMAAAGVFVCCGMLAVQGLAAQLLPYRLFLRVSSFLQLASFFTILGVYFLKPSRTVAWLPSSWFFGLQQRLSGAAHPLSTLALQGLAIAIAIAGATFALAYRRSVRRIVEQPDILPNSANRRRSALPWPRTSLDRAIVLFTARTIARSRQHRLFLAAYGGIGLAVAFAYGRDLLYGPSNSYEFRLGTHWNQLNVPLLMAGLVLLCFAVVGARAIFALPISLSANWIFRLTAVSTPGAYFSAVRKSLFAVTVVPIWAAMAAIYFLIWPARPALQHMVVLVLLGILLVHRALAQFRKLPFACSYLPGKANIHVRLGVYGLVFISVASLVVQIEFFAIPHARPFTIFCAVLLAAAAHAWYRWREFARSQDNWLQFEDLPPADVEALDLH